MPQRHQTGLIEERLQTLVWGVSLLFYSPLNKLIHDKFLSTIFLIFFVYISVGLIIIRSAYTKTKYWITNKRIVVKRGILSEYFVSIFYKDISEMQIVEPMANFFNLVIKSRARITYPIMFIMRGHNLNVGKLMLEGIPNPEQTKKKILKLAKVNAKS